MTIQEKLPEAELDVMLSLWKDTQPVRTARILEALQARRTWTASTLKVVLGRLVEKGRSPAGSRLDVVHRKSSAHEAGGQGVGGCDARGPLYIVPCSGFRRGVPKARDGRSAAALFRQFTQETHCGAGAGERAVR